MVLNYVVGGRLGDFLHLLYVIMCKYETTGHKGNLYITWDLKWGGDHFTTGIHQTFTELYEIVTYQPYIESFQILTNQDVNFDVNLNDFRRSPLLFKVHWLELLAHTFQVPLLSKPWIHLPPTCVNPKFEGKILAHQSNVHVRKVSAFLPFLQTKVNSDFVFITTNEHLYEIYPLKDCMPMEKVETIWDFFAAINSSKLFICNETSPLVMAFAINKPLLAENACGSTYSESHKYYPTAFWYSHNASMLDGLDLYLSSDC